MTADAQRLDRIEAKLTELLTASRQPAPRFLSLQQASAYASLSVKSLRRAVEAGHLTAFRPNGKLLLNRTDLDSWIIASANGRPRRGRGRRATA